MQDLWYQQHNFCEERIQQLEQQLEETDSSYDQEKIQVEV